MILLNVLAVLFIGFVYAVGSWVIVNWFFDRFVRPRYRLWFARKYGVPVPILLAWEEEWRRDRGRSD